ncbi:MAG: hypothetical protein ORN49_12745 [Rhodobacteraceae bacterium]|nr:hypothetical protein [Paracoccaceae bacterium]
MMLLQRVTAFHLAEEGAVTVDWLMVTAIVVGLGIAAFALVRSGTQSVGETVESGVGGQSIEASFSEEPAT